MPYRENRKIFHSLVSNRLVKGKMRALLYIYDKENVFPVTMVLWTSYLFSVVHTLATCMANAFSAY